MLKLKYLFNNKDLAQMILENWEYDVDDPNLFNYYRISSNAVYWCKNKGNRFFLRFTPAEETSKERILSELEFLKYLRNNGYPAVDTVLSKGNKELEVVNTPWGNFYAVAFKKASGKSIEEISLTKEIIFGLGKALGSLHKLSNQYTPLNNKRKDWKEAMEWMEEVLCKFPNEIEAKNELNLLKDALLELPVTKENFGLVHYDFETDNVFYDEITNAYNPIDFDDAMYHWYAMDIEQTLDSLKENISEEQLEASINHFIDGYRSEYNLSQDMLTLLPLFRRYGDLYGYIRLLYSIEEKWNNEPEWMVKLRGRLENLVNRRKGNFGKPI